MKALDKLLGNMRATVESSPLTAAPTPPATGPLDGWRNDRGVGLLALDRIVEDPEQPREEFDAAYLDGLATSIRAHGVLQPVLVRWRAELQRWMLVGGTCRFRAAKAAGLTAIPAKRIEGEPSAVELLEQRVAEQLLRCDWKPSEEAQTIVDIMSTRGWNGREASKALGLHERRIYRCVALLKLPEDLRRRVDAGEIPPAAAVELARLPADEARALADQGLTVSEVSSAVKRRAKRRLTSKPAAPPPASPRSVTRIACPGGMVIVELTAASGADAVEAALRHALGAFTRGEAA